ncbi:MAG: hypothetical protein B6D56_00210 [Candidatus Omnitrophica bacterium 4484_70.1]|nr:MAG: hypothetical protein B6D56_00210 [Candidatus Omnitrophica bacterium 4484_70.1]
MVNLNKVFLVGNLTVDPQLRYTSSGIPVITLRIAVNTPFKNKNGEAKRDTCFINVVVWGRPAEICNQYLTKGRAIFVEGRLQSRSWQDNEGKKRTTIEVRAQRVQFMPPLHKEEAISVDLDSLEEEIPELDEEGAL